MGWKISPLLGLVGVAFLACSDPKPSDTPDASGIEGGSEDSPGGDSAVDSGSVSPDVQTSDAGADSGPDGAPDAETDTGGPDTAGLDAATDTGSESGPDAGGGPTPQSLMDLDSGEEASASQEAGPSDAGMGAYVFTAGGSTVTSNTSNTGGDSTNLPLYANPGAVITVTQNFNSNGGAGAYNDHNVGVWYHGSQWAVFNEDSATMPEGVSFNVGVSAGDSNNFILGSCSGCVSGAAGGNNTMKIPETGNYAVMVVTPVWNPFGSGGAYHNHTVGLYYDGSAWFVFNEDQSTMPSDVAFSVRVVAAQDGAYTHVSSAANTIGDYTVLDNPSLNGHPGATVFVTHVYDTPGFPAMVHDHPIGVWYNGSKWAIFNEDRAPMPIGVAFNVVPAAPAM